MADQSTTKNSLASIIRQFRTCLIAGVIMLLVNAQTYGVQQQTNFLQQFGLGSLSASAISKDGHFIVTAGSGGAYVWRTQDGQRLETYREHRSVITAVAVSPDNNFLATAGWDRKIKFWNRPGGNLISETQPFTEEIRDLAFSPDGEFVASAAFSGPIVALWKKSDGTLVRTFEGHANAADAIAFSPDGQQLLTGSWDKTARLWNVADGSLIRTFEGHTGSIYSVSFSPDGTQILTCGSFDKRAIVWRKESGEIIREFVEAESDSQIFPDQGVYSGSFSPDGLQVLLGLRTGTTKLYRISDGQLVQKFQWHGNTVDFVAFGAQSNQVITASSDYLAKFWDVPSGSETQTLAGHTFPVYAAAFSPSGMQIAAGAGPAAEARIWSIGQTGNGHRVSAHSRSVTSMSFSPNGEHIATTGGELLNFNRAVDGELLWTKRLALEVRGVAHSPDGAKIAVVGSRPMMLASSNGAALWTNQTIFFGRTTAFSPDGRYVATDSAQRIGSSDIFSAKLLNATDGQVVRSFPGHNSYVQSVAFSPNGQLLATGSWDGTARLWNVDAGTALRTLNVTDTNVSSVAFSPDGKYLIVGSYDAMARIYRVDDGQVVLELAGHNNRVTTAAFSPIGSQALTASEDGTVLLWSLSGSIAIDLALKISTEGPKIRISWTGDGQLQSAAAVTGPYEKVSGATNPMIIEHTDAQFFRCVRE